MKSLMEYRKTCHPLLKVENQKPIGGKLSHKPGYMDLEQENRLLRQRLIDLNQEAQNNDGGNESSLEPNLDLTCTTWRRTASSGLAGNDVPLGKCPPLMLARVFHVKG